MNLLENMKDNDFYSSVKSTLTERFSSSMYGTFVIAWCLWNWQAIYTTLFVDQALIFTSTKLFKIDYIWQAYYHTHWYYYILKMFIAPALSVIVALWGLSYFDFLCYQKTCSNKYKQERERIKQAKEIEEEKKDFLDIKEENVIKENVIKKEMTEEEIWSEEYEKLEKKDNFMNTINTLRMCIYDFNGHTNVGPGDYGYARTFYMAGGQIAFLEVNNIVKKTGDDIELTSKGKFFLKRFFEEEGAKI